jgi:large subunit ribosomal protein L33
MAKNENRVYSINKCSECGKELRPICKNKKNNPERLELKRYCSNCRKHTIAKEKK